MSRFVSSQWVYLATIIHGVSQIDQIRMAIDASATSIRKIKQQEADVRDELLLIPKKVRGMDRTAMKSRIEAEQVPAAAADHVGQQTHRARAAPRHS